LVRSIYKLNKEIHWYQCIKIIHELGHYENKDTYHFLPLQACLPKMRKEVKTYVQNCITCNRNKSNYKPIFTTVKYDILDKLEYLHIYITGPLHPNKDFKYLVYLEKLVKRSLINTISIFTLQRILRYIMQHTTLFILI